MPRTKPFTKNAAFGAKKRSKGRGRHGGRKPSNVGTENTGENLLPSSSAGVVEANQPSTSSSTCIVEENQPSTSASIVEENHPSFENIEKCATAAQKQRYFEDDYPNVKLCPGYRIVSISALEKLVGNLACPKCYSQEIKLQERLKGMALDFTIYCAVCNKNVSKVSSSDYNENNSTSNINLLTVASAINNGLGYSKLCNFVCGLNLPIPLHLKTFQELRLKVENAVELSLEEHFQNVASIIKQEYRQVMQDADDDIVNIAVSFDGSWHKRGHSSLFGLGAAVDLLTGLVIDVAVMSKYCQGCVLAKSNPGKYAKHHCQINYEGSSGAMEVKAALLLFQRSVQKYGLRYLTVLSDGDSKAFLKLKEENVYGDMHPIVKEECINHVSKRMGSALRKLKESSKQSGIKLGGKGRLTNEKIEKIQNYYGRALKDNAPDIESMRNAVYASLFHMVSTNEEPHHSFCPKGIRSWCHYNRAVADPSLAKSHKPTLSKDIGEMLLPIYKRLTDGELLERCTRNTTQNNNESLHSVIWQKCPKGLFASYDTVKTAASLAVLQFNKGPKAFFDVLSKLDIPLGKHQKEVAARVLKRKLSDATRKSANEAKVQRKRQKITKTKSEEKHEEREGVVYEAGAF